MTVTHPSMRRAKTQKSEQQKQEVYIVENSFNTNPESMPGYEQEADDYVDPPSNVKSTEMLEDLLFLGLASKVVEIGTMKFEISTLTQKENTMLMKSLYSLGGDGSDLFVIRNLTLAYSIKSVNNVLFENIPLDGEFQTHYDKRLALIEQMQRAVIEKLYDEYTNLTEESDNLVNSGEIKK